MIGLWLISIPVMVPLIILMCELAMGLMKLNAPDSASDNPPRVVILMPAHNEAAIIAETVKAVLPALPANSTLLIVADNCTDETAQIARESGATVIERTDPGQRGKGYALAFGKQHLEQAPPDCVIILDADCLPGQQALNQLAQAAVKLNRPVQANYQFVSPKAASPLVQISNFAFFVKNLIRQRGMARIGGTALLTGAGMAFPWPQFAQAAVATDAIVEDLAMGVGLLRSGHAPLFLETATITSAAASAEGTMGQRRRWEHGYMDTMRRQALPLIFTGLKTGSRPVFWTGLHLLVPPLALLMFLAGLHWALLGLCTVLGRGVGPFITLGVLLLLCVALLSLAWAAGGRRHLSVAAALRLPLYMIWKIPIYLGVLIARQVEWNKTGRT